MDVDLDAAGQLTLRYRLDARPADLRLPPPATPGAADNLWQTTCLEAFVATPTGDDYREFNFSPSGQWAVYRFTGYRQRDESFRPASAPHLSLLAPPDHIVLEARLAADLLPAAAALHLGLSVVIEAADGGKSYWALRHAAAQPDFHLRASFTLDLKRNLP